MIYVTRWPSGHEAGGFLSGITVLESFVLTQIYRYFEEAKRKIRQMQGTRMMNDEGMLVEQMLAYVAILWNAFHKRTRSHVLEMLPSFRNAQFCSLSNSMEMSRTQNVISCLVIP